VNRPSVKFLYDCYHEQISEGNKDAAIALYQRALTIMDPPHPIHDELRTEMEGIVKGMNAPPPKPPAARKPAPAKAVPTRK